MLDVKNIFAVLCVFLLALQPLKNLTFFYIDFVKQRIYPIYESNRITLCPCVGEYARRNRANLWKSAR